MNNKKHETPKIILRQMIGLKERGDLHTELFLASSNKGRFIFDSMMKQAKCLEEISFAYQLNARENSSLVTSRDEIISTTVIPYQPAFQPCKELILSSLHALYRRLGSPPSLVLRLKPWPPKLCHALRKHFTASPAPFRKSDQTLVVCVLRNSR